MSTYALDVLRSAYQRAVGAVDLPDTPTADPWQLLEAASDASVAAHKLIEAQTAEIERLHAVASTQYAAGYSRGRSFAEQRAAAALQQIIHDHDHDHDHDNADDGQTLKVNA